MNSGSHPLPVRPARADFATCAAGDIVPGRKARDFVRPGTGRISFSTHLSHAARRVFIFHAQTHVCAFTRALRRVFMRFLPASHTPQGVFSSFMHKRTYTLSFAPSGAFSFVCPPSHTPQGVFSFFMRKRTFALSFAPSGAFSCVCCPTRRSRVLYSEPASAGDSQ